MSDEPQPAAPGPSDGTGRVMSPVTQAIQRPRIDSRSAASEALVAYLKCARFVVASKVANVDDTEFALREVNRQWPEPSDPLAPPVATVLDFEAVQQDAWAFVPAPLEDTLDCFGDCTVLWKTAEMVASCQVDFWLGNEPEREAVAAALPSLFAPAEDEWGVRLLTPTTYYSREARFSLLSMQRVDDPGSVYPRERRLLCRIGVQLDEVHLRSAPRTRIAVDLRVRQPGSDTP